MTCKILFCTGNENKRREVEELLRGGGTSNFVLEKVSTDLPELQGTPDVVAKGKCVAAWESLPQKLEDNTFVLVEDTSLSFEAYGELPGVYIKWFLEGLGNDKLHLMLSGFDSKVATAATRLALWDGKTAEPMIFLGETRGTLVPPRGPRNFGWDPNFLPDGFDKTYAEMTSDEKNEISHRSKALSKLRDHLKELSMVISR